MDDQIHYLTREGLEKVKKELEFLTKFKRQEIADRLEFAIKQGDISENADYEIAREDMGFNEGRISELENIIINAKLITNNALKDTIQVGSRVTVCEQGFPPETYTIVGPTEASPADGLISNKSPVGSALLGKRVGDIARISTPNGQIEMEITAIE